MQNQKKKIIIIVGVVILAILITLLTVKLINIEKNKEKEVSNLNQNAIENNTIENAIKNENTENTENIVVVDKEKEDNNKNDLIETSPTIGEEEITKTEIEKKENDEEKAVNIVKKDWGEDNSVYFTIEETQNEKYTISVREKDTTRTISTYEVNIQTETFIKD